MNRIHDAPSVTIRQPATANLMVDSADRSTGVWSNFTINKTNSIFNGFFNRVGVTEMVLEWNEPNIQILPAGSSVVAVSVVGAPANPYAVVFPEGFYTVESALDSLVALLNAAAIPGVTWQVTAANGIAVLGIVEAGRLFSVLDTPLARRLAIYNPPDDGTQSRIVGTPDLRPYRYLDFISRQLTYNQELKDASTAPNVRDVLLRWYFAWDVPTNDDGYGYPILMGYTAFVVRRIYSPPKQIRWDPSQPVGQLGFEVYTDDGTLVPTTTVYSNNFLMTLQASEN